MIAYVSRILVQEILGGALVGFRIGAYVRVLTGEYVVQRGAFDHAVAYEETQSRYAQTVLLAFIMAFAGTGPFVAAASFGPWIRYAVYGLLCAVIIAVSVILVAASITDQQPFNTHKGSRGDWIAIGRNYAIPAALLAGPLIGLLVRASLKAHGKSASPEMSEPRTRS